MTNNSQRRGKGSGSVRARGANRWQIRYQGLPDEHGTRKMQAETVNGSRSEAERVLRERAGQVESGSFVRKSTETVAEFMYRWLETYAATNTTPRTQQGYRGNVERYINPAIGQINLQALRPEHIQKMYAALLERNLSARTILHVHRVLSGALEKAVQWDLLVRNPAKATTPPRPENEQMAMWDVESIKGFSEAAQTSLHRNYFELAILTGMRRSELSGLKWDAVDLGSGRLMVLNTLQRLNGRGLVDGRPKTPKSRRSIALSPNAVTLLKRIKTNQFECRLAAGPAWSNTDYVFTSADGNPIDPDALTHEFHDIVTRAGLPPMTLHGLRHAHATLLLMKKIPAKVVSERLGHSNIAVTMDTYSHVLPDMQEEAALAIDDGLSFWAN